MKTDRKGTRIYQNTNFKTILGVCKHLASIAINQDMSDCKDWDKLTKEQQEMFYGLLAGLQNDLGEISNSFVDTGLTNEPFYNG